MATDERTEKIQRLESAMDALVDLKMDTPAIREAASEILTKLDRVR